MMVMLMKSNITCLKQGSAPNGTAAVSTQTVCRLFLSSSSCSMFMVIIMLFIIFIMMILTTSKIVT